MTKEHSRPQNYPWDVQEETSPDDKKDGLAERRGECAGVFLNEACILPVKSGPEHPTLRSTRPNAEISAAETALF